MLVVDVGMLGCFEPGIFVADQAELDELAMFDDVVQPVSSDPQPVAGQCVEVVGAGEDLGRSAGQREVQRG